MLALQILGLILLYVVWQIEKNDTKKLDSASVFIRLMIAGLFILGLFFVVFDILDFLLEITGQVMFIQTKVQCPECSRVFDLLNDDDTNEWFYGHDCEEDFIEE